MMPVHHLENIKRLAKRIGRPVRFMEVCGTHTMTAFRSGLRSLLPLDVTLLSGPGCPVCVTPNDFVDSAIALARRPDSMITTFGDLLRVPGTESSLERERARGADIRVVYSVLDALALAAKNPDRKVVFLGVGFETTAPTVAWSIRKASRGGLGNFLVLSAHRTMPPAMAALLSGGEASTRSHRKGRKSGMAEPPDLSAEAIRAKGEAKSVAKAKEGEAAIDGFLCPGHVSAVIGTRPYEFISRDYSLPCVVAGFEADDMLVAIAMLLKQLAENRAQVENQYTRGVNADGNLEAQAIMAEVFEPCNAEWRGLGVIPLSGLGIRAAFRAHDAQAVLKPKPSAKPARNSACLCGDVLRGVKPPTACTLFRTACTPETPVGACMVSSEGACAAWYRYGKYVERRA